MSWLYLPQLVDIAGKRGYLLISQPDQDPAGFSKIRKSPAFQGGENPKTPTNTQKMLTKWAGEVHFQSLDGKVTDTRKGA